MKIYMDTCCYTRPFDDQMQDKIRMESEAIMAILYRCENEVLELVGSEVLEYELSNNMDNVKRLKAETLYKIVKESAVINEVIEERAKELEKFGLKSFDSLHLSCAEYLQSDILLTVDIGFMKGAAKSDSFVKVQNPVNWLMEVIESE